ncbi:MAG: tyrosine-type recombinase/integrase [Pseudomonadales bacterium]|nr:tyrosine-type recombinase/integrase [Pseudomonadales bacterium]
MLKSIQVKQATPREKPYKLTDEKGLYLYITPKGQKYWRFNYRFAGKRKTLALGVFPETGLAKARIKHAEARKQIENDRDPADIRRAAKLARALSSENSFEAVALEWFTKEKPNWSASHTDRVARMLNKYLIPHIGHRIIGEITAPDLLACLRKVEARGTINTAHRVKQVSGQVFRYAVTIGKAERSPGTDLTGALATVKPIHMAAITEPKEVGLLLLMLDDYQGTPEVATALKLAPLLFCRPGELRSMEWNEIKFEKHEWHIPGQKMKTKQDHIVPLCKQATEALESLLQLTGHRQYVFPSARSPKRPMSDNAVLSAMRRLGIPKEKMTGHGFRAMARTLLDEELGYRIEWIECQLAHAVKDANGRAYNRTTYLKQRKEMMQHWGDYLDSLKAEALNGNVIAGTFPKTN